MALGPIPMDPNAPVDPSLGAMASPSPTAGALDSMDANGKLMERDNPELSPSREALVKAWAANVKAAKEHWKADFKRMRDDQEFARGKQWPGNDSSNYVVNITLRHVQQRVAALYAKNPKAIARRRQRLLGTVWDGTNASLKTAQAAMQAAAMAGQPQVDPMTGAVMPPPPPDPTIMQGVAMAQAVIEDAANVRDQIQQINQIGKTLEIVYEYNIQEQVHPFKTMMKLMVRRAITTGVGYVKLGFQRLMEVRPEVEARIADISLRLATLEQLSADVADGIIQKDTSPELEQLRLLAQSLDAQKNVVTREGLIFDYPASTSIIPDPKCQHLREFLGADWVAQEYMLSVDEIKKIYKVDVGKSYNAFKRAGIGQDVETLARRYMSGDGNNDSQAQEVARVWEIYAKSDGLVYVVCDGYKDFLREPTEPECYMERFYPWFALVMNECDDEKTIFPPSDVSLIRHPQMEINRSREGLREHRVANRPLTATAQGALDEEDLAKLERRPANAIVELNGLQPGQKVDDLLQSVKGPGIDPNMYETQGAFDDIMRSVGTQEANLGGTSNSTATESSIAQASQTSALGSSIDDLNDVLTQLARSAGQILLLNVSKETATMIAGPGAIWPEMTAQDVAQEIYLEIEANSTGRPNQAEEIANAEKLVPLLLQIPGINPEFIAKELLRRMDDRLDLSEAFTADLPSVVAMNSMKGMSPAGGGMAPEAPGQGPQGATNAQQPPPMDSQGARSPGPSVPAPGLQ